MSRFPRHSLVAAIFLSAALVLSACSSSGSNAKANVETQSTRSVVSSLKQRPSEININVRGKITRTGEIYLLRGLANVFSRGMDAIGAQMVRKGLDARVYNHAAWQDLADNIVARSKRKQVSYPIVIMGHSLGANAASLMADYLGKRGVKVSYVVAFDPTIPTRVGKNVGRVVNLYIPNDSHSNVVRKGEGFTGTLINRNVSGNPSITHTNIEKNPRFQRDVINRAYGYTKRRRKARG